MNDTSTLTLDLEGLKARVAALGKGDCNNTVLAAAQRIAEPESDGKSANVYAVLPQLAKAVGELDRDKIPTSIDLDKNGEVSRAELTTAMIAAARIAHSKGIALEEVSVADIARLSPEIYQKLQVETSLTCGTLKQRKR